MGKLLKPNLDNIGITIFLFLLTSFLFLLFTHPETVQPVWLLTLIPLYFVSSFLSQLLVKQILLKRVLRWIVFTPITILVLLSLISQFAPDKPPKDFLITKNFIDLNQVHRFTKYRSCSGHQTVDQYSDEPVSNMQHYIPILASVDPDKIGIYAPFDGYILGSAPNTLVDEGVTMVPKSGIPWWPFNQWRFAMNHTHVLPQFQDPPIHFVKAGTLVGYVNALDRYGQRIKGTQVRMGVIAIPPMFKNGNGEPYKKLNSVFNYMTDEVFARYQAAIPGLKSREDMTLSKEYRLTHPCKFKQGGPNFSDRPPYFDSGRVEDLPLEEQDVYIGVGINDLEGMQKARMCDDPEDIARNPECSN
ncbi:MAG: hypothetical protein HYU80_02675 [Candidatus Blackburnbacteria bacterium]|nr:hypothetical protein [Candidatus Blackburnbacteria bacterium]